MGLPMENSTTPGRLISALRGQHLAEVTAIGITGAPVWMARRVPPVLYSPLLAAFDARAFGEHDDPGALVQQALALLHHLVEGARAWAAVDVDHVHAAMAQPKKGTRSSSFLNT
jgi:hypothetical protein